MHTWNVDCGIVAEHLLKAFGICQLANIINLFIRRATEFTVETYQIDKITWLEHAINNLDNKLQCAQIHAHQFINVWALNFYCDRFPCGSQDSFVDLSKGGGSNTFAFKIGEKL